MKEIKNLIIDRIENLAIHYAGLQRSMGETALVTNVHELYKKNQSYIATVQLELVYKYGLTGKKLMVTYYLDSVTLRKLTDKEIKERGLDYLENAKDMLN